ncbi:MAG: PDDEXK nuclease domain-containing protein [Tissierellia bacterium]|nr:PDDEXK nuclease domain-containing protein [Tissierellia bacterium]
MEQSISVNYADVVRQIKNAILQSRYRAAKLANREMLSLYFGIGKFISENSRNHFWGTSAIESISERLQQELPGLRGFSPANIKRMRQFYEEWQPYLITENHIQSIRPMLSGEIRIDLLAANRPTLSDDLDMDTWNSFLSIGFSHHYEIIIRTKTLEERFFYIGKCATEFWNYRVLQNNLKSNLFAKQGKLPNNFAITISDADLRRKALLSFKDEYLLDYINIESPDDEVDERVLESEIVQNIKNFIMSLGKDFAFIGNQHRFIVEEREYFVDLLFFNRQLQCLVAIDLKRGEFKPEYFGKMNFYLSAVDDLVRLPHENRSIGIILCKSKKEKIVEYAFRDTSKPMGVSTYKLAAELPEKYRDVLPDEDELRKLM